MEYNSTTMSSSDKEIKAIASPYNTRSKAMKSTSDKKGNKLSQSTLLPPSAFLPKKSKKEETYKKDESSDDDDNSEACDDDDSDDYITDSEESDDDAEYITDSEDNDDDPDFEKFIGNDKEFNKLADKEYKKFLAELFPSKYMKRRVEETEQYSSDEDDKPQPPKKSRKKISGRECPPAPKKPLPKYIQSQEELDIINKYEKNTTVNLKEVVRVKVVSLTVSQSYQNTIFPSLLEEKIWKKKITLDICQIQKHYMMNHMMTVMKIQMTIAKMKKKKKKKIV